MKTINRLNDVLWRMIMPLFENTPILQSRGTWIPQRPLWPGASWGEEFLKVLPIIYFRSTLE